MPATPRAPETERLLARFIRYCQVYTTSDEASESCPSSARQLDLARMLRDELAAMGLAPRLDEHGYVYATLPEQSAHGARRRTARCRPSASSRTWTRARTRRART